MMVYDAIDEWLTQSVKRPWTINWRMTHDNGYRTIYMLKYTYQGRFSRHDNMKLEISDDIIQVSHDIKHVSDTVPNGLVFELADPNSIIKLTRYLADLGVEISENARYY